MAKKVLIIEDYPATSKMISDFLQIEGIEPLVAIDGSSGREKALAEKPDLILLDIMLPGMSGLEVCSALKADPQTKDIPVIMVSVKASQEDIRSGLGTGAADYVIKPFDPFKLLEIIKKYLK